MTKDLPRPLETYQSYLDLFARTQLQPGLQHKFGVSDIVQQSLLEAHEARDQFGGQTAGELAAWLRRIVARNLADAIRDLRRDKRDVGRERPLDVAVEASSARLERWLAADQTSPSLAADRAEAAVRVADALATLPESQQEALVLRHWQGERVAAIAAQMQRSPEAVAGLLQRGARALKARLASDE